VFWLKPIDDSKSPPLSLARRTPRALNHADDRADKNDCHPFHLEFSMSRVVSLLVVASHAT
jgi:hypothetical protein